MDTRNRKPYNSEWKKKTYQNNPEKRERMKELSRLWRRKDYKEHPEKYKERYEKKKLKEGFREGRIQYNRNRRRELREKIISHYSNGLNKCECCGENHFEFLQIDHLNGNGEIHRKEIKRSAGEAFYTWLIKNNYPDGYRVLCSNCNQSLGMYGYCPHKIVKTTKKDLSSGGLIPRGVIGI